MCNMPSCRIIFPVTTSGLILWTDGFRKKKNLLSTFTLTPPQQFLQRSLAIIPQSNFWYDSGTVSKITGHTFSGETNFFSCHQADPYLSMVSMSMAVIRKCKFTDNLSSVIRNGLLAW